MTYEDMLNLDAELQRFIDMVDAEGLPRTFMARAESVRDVLKLPEVRAAFKTAAFGEWETR